MNFNEHSNLKDKHAFLSPSNYHWINYDDEKLDSAFMNFSAKERGTKLHAFAADAIGLGIELKNPKSTLSLYVNDAIRYKMTPEQSLYYSENCFGKADAISFRKSFLRIHDLKTGVNKASMHQLEIYAALFCLEYKVKPEDIKIELRLYQSNEVIVHIPSFEEIHNKMNRIIIADQRIEKLMSGEGGSWKMN
jgi:hypothetical protein